MGENETPNSMYGRLREAVNMSGYSLERAMNEFDWLLDEGRWEQVGDGFNDIDDFLETINLSEFKIAAEQRKEIAQKLATLKASNVAAAGALGVNEKTIRNDKKQDPELSELVKGTDIGNQDVIIKDSELSEETEEIGWTGDDSWKAEKKKPSQEKKEKEKEKEKESKQKLISEIKNEKSIYIQDIEIGWHKIGNQFLYYGSNLDKEFIDFLPDCKFGFADPPYNAGVDEWDSDFNWEQDFFISKCEVMAVTPGGWETFDFYKNTDMPYIWELICYITNGMTHGKCGYSNHIKASIFSKNKVKIPQDLFTISIKINETEDTLHKGRKPYLFMIELINIFSKENDFIFDLFAGSGTTLLISEKLNRVSYSAEIDKQSCIDIVNRAVENNIPNYGEQ